MPDESFAHLSNLLGRLEKAVDSTGREFRDSLSQTNKRVSALEEYRIRQEERAKTEDKIRAEFERAEERQRSRAAQADQLTTNRVSIGLYKWQLWAAVLAIVVAILIFAASGGVRIG